MKSEVLTLGLPDETGECVLITPDRNVPLGGRLF
jgi:tRNA-binding protein